MACVKYFSCQTDCHLLRFDTPWQWVVYLRSFITDSNGQLLLGEAQNQSFRDVIITYGNALVEESIRRAQRGSLNPKKSANHSDFSENKDSDEDRSSSELTFSSNCVFLQISSPLADVQVADIYIFCDIPAEFTL